MPARWLVDAAALAWASRCVVEKHLLLRGQQAGVLISTVPWNTLARQSANSNLERLSVTEFSQAAPSRAESFEATDLAHRTREPVSREIKDLSQDEKQHASQSEFYHDTSCRNSVIRPESRFLLSAQDKGTERLFSDETTITANKEQGKSQKNSSRRALSQPASEYKRKRVTDEAIIPYRIAREPLSRGGLAKIGGSESFDEPSSEIERAVFYDASKEVPNNAQPSPDTVHLRRQNAINQDAFYDPTVGVATDRLISDRREGTTGDELGRLFQNNRVGRAILGQNRLDSSVSHASGIPPGPWPPRDRLADIPQDTIDFKGPSSPHDSIKKMSEDGSIPTNLMVEELSAHSTADPQYSAMRESRVPSSRLGRLWQYAGLGASMTAGAAAEGFRRMVGVQGEDPSSLMLSAANVERLVLKLSKMRGAALKIGQLLSFQDSKVLPASIYQVLQRVQDSADFMPASQRNAVLERNLGADWRELFDSFEEAPLAAASIGQVHGAILKSSNQRVVVKIQYPGVASSIDSDLTNLSILLHASRLLPKGLYLDKTIANARTELAWECDYIREADSLERFQSLLADDIDVFKVPKVYKEASGPQVLTMERMEGRAVTKIPGLSQEHRDWIGSNILRLCLREITEFRYMQTDPNWTNFLFNPSTQKLELLDFGASREYPESFVLPYVRLLQAASKDNYEACLDLSIQLGYLTGMESKAMLDAHIKSITTIAEPFKEDAPDRYDFRNQTITDRVRALIPTMLKERLSPPPEETYSLHRKLSGAFLLLARLGSQVKTKDMFATAMSKVSSQPRSDPKPTSNAIE